MYVASPYLCSPLPDISHCVELLLARRANLLATPFSQLVVLPGWSGHRVPVRLRLSRRAT